MPQKITLDEDFYTGTELAAELKSKMDANTAFSDLGLTFTVSYTAATGIFSITPSSGNLKYLEINEFGTIPDRYSIAGHLFGLNANTSFTTPVTSDTAVPGLDSEVAVIDQTASSVLSHYIHQLSLHKHIRTSALLLILKYFVYHHDASLKRSFHHKLPDRKRTSLWQTKNSEPHPKMPTAAFYQLLTSHPTLW
mgnify:CR=1 FL=1